MHAIALKEFCKEVAIIAHNEDITPLQQAMQREGFSCRIFRGGYTPEQKGYAAQIRCLINHANAWRYLSEIDQPLIIVEADFVPVRGFGDLPVPFPPNKSAAQFGWLYSPGSILYGVSENIYPYGHGNTMVAYVATPSAANALLDFFEREMQRADKGNYVLWDTYIGIFLRWERGIYNYIPVYQYGEHGGLPNPEHATAKIRDWHQADILWSQLAFMPLYSRGSRVRYLFFRCRGWLRGITRLATLRFFDPRSINSDSSRGKNFMFVFSVLRLIWMAHFVTPLAGTDSAAMKALKYLKP